MREDGCSCEVVCRGEGDTRRSVDEGCSVAVREDIWSCEDCAAERRTVSVVKVDSWMGGGEGEERDGLGVADDSTGGASDDVNVPVETNSLDVCEETIDDG